MKGGSDFSQIKLVVLFSPEENTIYYDLYNLDWDLSIGIRAWLVWLPTRNGL